MTNFALKTEHVNGFITRQGRVVLRRRPVTKFEFLQTLVLESGTSIQNIQTESLLQFGGHLEHPHALIVTVFHPSSTLESIKKFLLLLTFSHCVTIGVS